MERTEINKLIKMHLQMRNLCLIKKVYLFVVLTDSKGIAREVIAVGYYNIKIIQYCKFSVWAIPQILILN